MDYMFSANRKRVMLTGFGPFGIDKINPSWEGVKFMDGREIENKYDITLFRKEIAVNYDEVDKIVPEMWHYYQPHLTIHVGLNDAVKSFVLEKKANKKIYKIRDEDNKLPKCKRNAYPGPKDVTTTLDVDRICREFNRNKCKIRDPTLRAQSSRNADKYLCEYIYYTSLCVGRRSQSPTLFVHVPFDKYNSKQLAYGLERILELCLNQLSKDDHLSSSSSAYSSPLLGVGIFSLTSRNLIVGNAHSVTISHDEKIVASLILKTSYLTLAD